MKSPNTLWLLVLSFIMFFAIIRSSRAAFFSCFSRPQQSPLLIQRMVSTNQHEQEDVYASSGYKKPTVSWYPGHIAKAERQLAETLRAVDVVVEVRNARAPKATSHYKVGEWCAGRPRIVVLTHVDAIPSPSQREWKRSYEEFGANKWDAEVNAQVRNQAIQAVLERQKYTPTTTDNSGNNKKKKQQKQVHNTDISPVQDVLFVNAKQGQGIHALQRAIFKAGAHVQERRERRGLKERPLRVGIIGYPNVGKSALINRILGRRRARTANTPGVTRALQWIRVKDSSTKKKEFELLDSPGVIPSMLENQYDAALLAACNCIGTKSYDNQAIAAFLCEWLKALHVMGKAAITAPQWRQKCMDRYGFDPLESKSDGNSTELLRTGEDMLFQVADNTCRGDLEDASRKILQDFRTGRMGPICLQLAPISEQDDGQQSVRLGTQQSEEERQELELQRQQERQERAASALETAKQQGLELPPIVESNNNKGDGDDEIGKGMFDGW